MALFQTQEETLDIRLGSDATFPITGNFEPIKGLELLVQDIQQLLLTIPGERVNRPEFGCNLRNQVWENLEVAARDGKASIIDAINRFEGRISLTGVGVSINRNTGLITFNIQFRVKEEDSPVNLIFPFRAGTQLSFS